MASPEEVATLLPETLPEDFGDWDGEASPAPSPGNLASGSRRKMHIPSARLTNRWGNPLTTMQCWNPCLAGRELRSQPRPHQALLSSKGISSIGIAKNFLRLRRLTVLNGKHGKPVVPSANLQSRLASPLTRAILESLVNRPPVSGSASPAPVSLKPRKLTSELVDVSPSPASHTPGASRTTDEDPAVSSLPSAASVDGMGNSPQLTATLRSDANEALFQMFRTKNIEVEGKPKTARKKWMTVPVICACLILLLLVLMIPLFHHGMKSAAKQSVQPPPGASDTQLKPNMPKPSASEPLTQGKPLATAEKQPATDNQPANEEEAANPAQVQSEMMNDQLTAPTQIPQGIKKPVADNGPPPASFGSAGADGLGGNGAIDGVFNGHAQRVTKVAPLKPLVISSGVAAGMLIQKMPPAYPPIAKSAHVSGTVELHATISKNGTIKDLHVVSGPAMLRQAAADAVRNWRYRPYRLNNEPTEIETTISVIFSLDR